MRFIDSNIFIKYNFIIADLYIKVKEGKMKIAKIGNLKLIMSNSYGKHNYFAWPTVTRLKNGKIAVVASGYRLRHICPFGKTVISYSEDEGETYTRPAPVIDTVLDDRDGGILAFGASNVIVSSFNNSVEFQRQYAKAYENAYLDTISPEDEEKALGPSFRISNDNGVTFGEIYKSPVTSPHGPIELPDGRLLWVGRTFNPMDIAEQEVDCIRAYTINADGSMEYQGEIENVDYDGLKPLSCEPHALVLDDGTILVHIRMSKYGEDTMFSIFQSESKDNGKTWSTPRQILPRMGGAPPHLFRHSSGMIICTYGYREKPFGIKAMFSKDNGKTWDIGYDIYVNEVSDDIGYPSTVELEDGSLLTVFYARLADNEPAVVVQQKWRFKE